MSLNCESDSKMPYDVVVVITVVIKNKSLQYCSNNTSKCCQHLLVLWLKDKVFTNARSDVASARICICLFLIHNTNF
jgi:hypothetical protein